MGLCQQKQYNQLSYGSKAKKNDLLSHPTLDDDRKLYAFFEQQQKKKLEEDKKFTAFFEDQQRKKDEQNKKIDEFLKMQQLQRKRNKKPNQTEMAKVIYAYMRLYGRNPDEQVKKFIEENYNDSYRSQNYPLGSTSPRETYKYELSKRLETAHENYLISDHVRFEKADEEKRTIEYEWTVRNQMTNYRTVYDCKATFDDKNRFLTLVLRQLDRYNYKPAPPQPKNEQKPYKPSWQSPSNNYYPPPKNGMTEGEAEFQRSQAQFRKNMNRQAQDWNNYVRQKNARGY